MRTYVFGDVGGHSNPFFASLASLGVDLTTYEIPNDRTIVQIGDLIHKGPDSNLLVSTVDRLISNNKGQWIQIAGNHEFQHLGGYQFWDCACSGETVETLRKWFRTGDMTVAYGFEHEDNSSLKKKSSLVTHAGLGYEVWQTLGSATESATDVARLINKANLASLNVPGNMLHGVSSKGPAGPFWAEALREVYWSWFDTPMPFNQFHGHTTPWDWVQSDWRDKTLVNHLHTLLRPENHIQVDALRRVSTLTLQADSGTFVGVDPDYGILRVEEPYMPYYAL